MILIADSGSTKTSWCVADISGTPDCFTTGGINPFFRNTEDIIREWKESPLSQFTQPVKQIFFYGAGIVNKEKSDIIRKALHYFFPGTETDIQSDLMGAARAILGNKKGIACILGTGSNSCLYDGEKIIHHVPPLGFILGDEGSGAAMGKQLVSDYLKKCMPRELEIRFNREYPLSYDEILNGVYRKDHPNKFLAGFTPFLKKYIGQEYCNHLVKNAFEMFLMRNVAQYDGYETQPVGFAGSVAYHFQDQLKHVLLKHNVTPITIIKEPLDKLILFHRKLQ